MAQGTDDESVELPDMVGQYRLAPFIRRTDCLTKGAKVSERRWKALSALAATVSAIVADGASRRTGQRRKQRGAQCHIATGSRQFIRGE